ncbi:MAG: carboxypeptidase regulatory-like domain-containing protein, partial [Acidobacteriaceae bacterium]
MYTGWARKLLPFFLTAPLIMAPALMAQTGRASLTGIVTDPTGAPVPGVTITATDTATHVATKTQTNSAGLYRVVNLPVGSYSVTYAKSGFESVVRSGIVLYVAQVADINIRLTVGSLQQIVHVKASAPILQTQTADVGTTMTNHEVENLPLSISGGREVENFAYAIMPNVDGNNWTSYIAGTPSFSKSVLLDGTLEQGSETGSFDEIFPSMDAIQEFKVTTGGTGGQAAAYTAGGTFMFTLKSGTNQWHGSAFEYLHNEALNANTWMNNYQIGANPGEASQYKRPLDRQNDYGASFGGPILKNKTFFYTAYEHYTLSDYAMGLTTVPTAPFLAGNFSSLLGGPILDSSGSPLVNPCTGAPYLKGQIFDPTTARTVGGQSCAMPFEGNVISPSRFSPVSSKLVGIYQKDYAPINSGAINNAQTPQNNNPYFHMNQFSVKVDHNLSDTDRMSGSYIKTSRPRYLLDSTSGIWQQGTNGGGPFSQARLQDVASNQFRLQQSYTLSPTALNVASFTFISYVNPSQPLTEGGNWPQQLGLGSTLNGYDGIPDIDFGSAVSGVSEQLIGENNLGSYTSNIFVFDDSFTKVAGRHTINFGGEFRAFQMNSHAGSGNLSFHFSNAQTGQPNNATVSPYLGFGFASFLLGDVNSASEGTPMDLYGRRKSLSLYASDNFKVNSKLTLTMGLTWNQTYPLHEKYGNWANFNTVKISPEFDIPGTIEYAGGGGDSFEGPVYWKAFAPHFGAAYQITHRIVLRAAYSMYYAPIATNFWTGVPYGYAPQARGTDQVNTTGTMAAAFNWDGGYPGTFIPGTKDPNYLEWGPVSVSSNALMPGRTNQWNVGLEFELTPKTRLSVYYLGTRGTHLHDGELQNDGPTLAQEPAFLDLMKAGGGYDWVASPSDAAAAGVPYPYAGFQGFAYMAYSSFPQVAALYS